jgi:hypothetical protein
MDALARQDLTTFSP